MSLTVTLTDMTVVGNKRLHTFKLAFDSSYPTGGESLTAANLGLSTVDFILIEPASGYLFEYDHTNSKVIARYPLASHTHTENTAATYTQNATTAASTASAGSQVSNGTDLSALTDVRGFALGS